MRANKRFVAVGTAGAILSCDDGKLVSIKKKVPENGANQLTLVNKNNRLMIFLPKAVDAQGLTPGIFSISGKTSYNSSFSLQNGILDISTKALPKGLYVLKIADGNKFIASSKFLLIR